MAYTPPKLSETCLFRDVVSLSDLEIGDMFVNVNAPKDVFIVRGNQMKNKGAMCNTRVCSRLSTLLNKSCNIHVVKVGESIYKAKMKLNPKNFLPKWQPTKRQRKM